MHKSMWTPVLAWVGAVGGALLLAFGAPQEGSVLGRVPSVSAKRLDQRQIMLPQELPAARTLAFVVFKRGQRDEVQSWIDGLQLRQDASIPWLKLPVLNDPGNAGARKVIEDRLLARHDEQERARLVPLFLDRDAFIRAAGLSGAEHASVLVLDRDGNVLARAEGAFDHGKAAALRETVLAQGY